MKIVVNAINLKVGGGVTVVMNFLQSVIENQEYHRHTYHVLAPRNVGYEEYDKAPVTIEIVPQSVASAFKRLWLDYTWLQKRIDTLETDVVFTMGNFAIPTSKKQGVLFMLPYVIYPEDEKVWQLLDPKTRLDFRLRNRMFNQRLKYADVVFPQTQTSQQRLHKYYGKRLKRTQVIPTAYSRIDAEGTKTDFFEKESDKIYLLCLTKYYKHKNVEIFIPLAKKLKESNSNIRIVSTIGADQGDGAQAFIKSIQENQLSDYIINIGAVPMNQVPALYDQIDALLLPTLLESFSATYADSLSLKKSIFTSDRDFARDVCGEAAFYFNPHDVHDIYTQLTENLQKPRVLAAKRELGYQRTKQLPNWKEVTNIYIQALEELCEV